MKYLLSLICLCAGAILFADPVTVGATTPFTSFEAEDGTLGGGAIVRSLTVWPKERSSPEKEASGGAFVELKGTGQSVTWRNTTQQNFTAINIRFSIPDAPQGGGTTNTLNLYVDGQFRQSVSLSSAQCWLYKRNENKDPSQGSPYEFFDETHFFITGGPLAPGGTITLQQDQNNTAAFYWIDVIDLENPPAPLIQPANSLSITDFGAVANDKTVDCTKAIQQCFDTACEQKKIAWIPAGIFYRTTVEDLRPKNITIQGAGTWYSEIYRICPIPPPPPGRVDGLMDPDSCTLKDFSLDENACARDAAHGDSGGICIKGNDWVVDTVWVQHASSGLWGDGINGTVKNCRMNSSWGDGINLNNSNSGRDGNNLTAENNFVRGTGDDGLAINSDKSSHLMNHITFINNTSVAPWNANGFGIYGGSDILVKNNLIRDARNSCGMSVGVFSSGGSPLVSGIVEGNVIIRSGNSDNPGLGIGTHNELNSIANVYVANNTIINPVSNGVALRKGKNVVVENNHVEAGNKPGFVVESFAIGSGIFFGNSATNFSSGDPATLEGTAQYTVIRAIPGINVKKSLGALLREPCSDGGQDLGGISDCTWTMYSGIDLTGRATFNARVASSGTGGTISIYLDSATDLVGTCTVPATGGVQNWINVSCALTNAASGTHDVYLVYHGTGKDLFRLKWFAFSLP